MDKELGKLYEAYVKAMEAAYENEYDFYKNKPHSQELKYKAEKAYEEFDNYRKKG